MDVSIRKQRARPPRLFTVSLFAVVVIFSSIGVAAKAREDFYRPFPAWMTDAPRWYDDVLGSFTLLSVAIACVVYLTYRIRLRLAGLPAAPRPWSSRREVRAVLKIVAVLWFLQLPLSVYATYAALHDADRGPTGGNAISLFPIGGLIAPLGGVVLLIYDRGRWRTQCRVGNLCVACGYDLRATPIRCPECGEWRRRWQPKSH